MAAVAEMSLQRRAGAGHTRHYGTAVRGLNAPWIIFMVSICSRYNIDFIYIY